MTRKSWDEYFLEIARTVASRSTCLRIPDGVGAVLVRDNRILTTGYAGSIRGARHCAGETGHDFKFDGEDGVWECQRGCGAHYKASEVKSIPNECSKAPAAGCLIDEKTGGCVRTVHAEINAVLQAANHGVKVTGATSYTTMSPCWDCFKALVNGGVTRIVYSLEYRIVDRQKEFAASLGIPFIQVGTEKYVPGVTS